MTDEDSTAGVNDGPGTSFPDGPGDAPNKSKGSCRTPAPAVARCACGSDATSLNPAEVVVHRADGPCYIAPRAALVAAKGDEEEMG